ncbi:MAG: AEC family transporter [Halanaerobiales bacterium]
MQFNILINEILVLFIIILIGYIIRKKNIIDEEINKGFSRLLIQITLPALIIKSILRIELSQEIIKNLGLMTVISLLSYLTVIILASFISKRLNCFKDKKNIFKFLLVFGNVGYMGIPVVSAIFPAEAVVYTIINNIMFNIFLWTYGIHVLSVKSDREEKNNIQWRKLINHGTVALFIGFLVLITKINLGPVKGAIETVGNMTFPLSMIIIGSSLTNVKFLTILKDRILYYVIFLKLLIIPFAALLLIKQLPLPELVASISIIMLAMPSGAISVIFAEKFDSDYKFASEGIFFTTLLSLFTIPLFIWLIKIF